MKKKYVLSACVAMLLCLCFWQFSAVPAEAASAYKTAASGTAQVEAGKTATVPFSLSSKKYVMVYVEAKSATGGGISEASKLALTVKKTGGKTVAKTSHAWEDMMYLDGDEIACLTKKIAKKGQYSFILTNATNQPLSLKYTVRTFKKPAPKASIKKKRSCKSQDWTDIGKLKGGAPLVKSVKFSNKKIINEWDIETDGEIYVYGKKAGTTNVTVTLKNGKKYTCKVTVQPEMPDVYAYLNYYDTRDNYFEVRVKNNSSHTITIIRAGGKVENVDYKSFDRDFKDSKPVKIKPGKTKNVRFYCKGNPTWYDYKDYTLFAKIKCEGKTYTWHVWDEDSVFKKGSKWVSTYKDEEAYSNWY